LRETRITASYFFIEDPFLVEVEVERDRLDAGRGLHSGDGNEIAALVRLIAGEVGIDAENGRRFGETRRH
jgi:hypothetical protein